MPDPTLNPVKMTPGYHHRRPLTPKGAGDWLRLKDFGYPNPEKTVLYWIKLGKLGSVKIGNKRGVLLEQLVDFVSRDLPNSRKHV